MKVLLIGYPGSQMLVPASKYLTDKYLPGFDVRFYNYTGDIGLWSSWCIKQLNEFSDKYIVFALDDYLLSSPINMTVFDLAMKQLDDETVCVKLCYSTPEEHMDYPVTTQYTVWDREFLIWVLEQTASPWDFEMGGSKVFKHCGKKSLHGLVALEYNTSSAISGRWHGVKLDGLNKEDRAIVTSLIK